MSQAVIKLARKWNDFGESEDVKNGNQVKIYVSDKDTGDDDLDLLASGFISGYTPQISAAGNEEHILVTVLGNAVKLNESIVTASGNTLVSYNSQSPSAIFNSLIDLYNTTVSGAVSFSKNIDTAPTTVSYDFQYSTYKEALDKVVELAPEDWWYSIMPDDTIDFHPRKWSADHKLVVGRSIDSISPFKNIENIYNIIYFIGDGIESVYRNETSIILYGEKTTVLQDRRVTQQTTADDMANRFLRAHQNPETKVRLSVLDNNIDETGRGYDIDKIKCGDTISIIHPDIAYERTLWNEFKWNESKWNGPIESVLSSPMKVVSLNYMGDKIILELSTRTLEIAKRVEDINRNLTKFITDSLT
ncbi:MAG: hypothetical protein ACTSQ8_22215 [Candidatus Helarchaeota archaeon]